MVGSWEHKLKHFRTLIYHFLVRSYKRQDSLDAESSSSSLYASTFLEDANSRGVPRRCDFLSTSKYFNKVSSHVVSLRRKWRSSSSLYRYLKLSKASFTSCKNPKVYEAECDFQAHCRVAFQEENSSGWRSSTASANGEVTDQIEDKEAVPEARVVKGVKSSSLVESSFTFSSSSNESSSTEANAFCNDTEQLGMWSASYAANSRAYVCGNEQKSSRSGAWTRSRVLQGLKLTKEGMDGLKEEEQLLLGSNGDADHGPLVDMILDQKLEGLTDLEEFFQLYVQLSSPQYLDVVNQFFNEVCSEIVGNSGIS